MEHFPSWLLATFVAALVALPLLLPRLPEVVKRALAALREGAAAELWRRMREWVRSVAPRAQPQPLDPERPEDWPGAVAVDANGTPVGTRDVEAHEREQGSGG